MRGLITSAIKNVVGTLNHTPTMVIIADVDDDNIHDAGQPSWSTPSGIAKVLTEWQPLAAELQEQLGLTVGAKRYKVFLPYRVSPGKHRLRVEIPIGAVQAIDAPQVEEIKSDEQAAAGTFGDEEYRVLHADWWTSHTRAIVELAK